MRKWLRTGFDKADPKYEEKFEKTYREWMNKTLSARRMSIKRTKEGTFSRSNWSDDDDYLDDDEVNSLFPDK